MLGFKRTLLQVHLQQSVRHIRQMNGILVNSFGDPSVLQYTSTYLPNLAPTQCMIKLHACGVNPVDTYIRSGAYGKLPQLPYIPGKDGAGVVISVGSEVEGISEGDRVYLFNSTTGTYAENCICNASNIFKLPSNISFSQGACLGTPAFTAYRALFQKAQAKPGELIFVHGASGGVGLMVVEMAKAAGMKVVGTAGTPEGIEVIFEYFYPVKSKVFITLIL
jgi:NADPH2:quinone reductase